ncbi:MAG: hypothetical protein LBL26_00065 [Peptococcaceae bacterium]|nr:hypothetical protein [Peptococcaceae bacterium]
MNVFGSVASTERAEAGRYLWTAKSLDKYDAVLLLPDKNDTLNARVQASFEAKLRGRGGITIHNGEARRLVALCSLYQFSGKVVVGSFDEPHGRKLRNLLDSGVATEETLIDDVILGAM